MSVTLDAKVLLYASDAASPRHARARELIEKGYDEALQKHYYKIYFDQET